MYELIASCVIGLILGFVGLSILRILFYTLHVGNRFYNFKLRIAFEYAAKHDNDPNKKDDLLLCDKLKGAVRESEAAISQERQYLIIDPIYKLIGARCYRFNLWDCRYCFCTFFGLLFFPLLVTGFWFLTHSVMIEDLFLWIAISYGSSIGFHDLIPKDII